MHLIDTHAHLEEIQEPEQALTEAKSANIIAVIAVGSDYESNQRTLSLAQTCKNYVFPALGMHPWNLRDEDIEYNLEFIKANMGEAVAIGEIGLDYDKRVRARAEKELQIQVLRRVLEMAKAGNKPVIVHSRYAWRDALNLVIEARLERAVFHWYTGTSGVLRDIINQGYFISATPAVEYHTEHRRAVKGIPLNRLLLETDSPVTYRRGTKFEYESRPVHLLRALSAVSELLNLSKSELAEVTTSNAVKFFGLPNYLLNTKL